MGNSLILLRCVSYKTELRYARVNACFLFWNHSALNHACTYLYQRNGIILYNAFNAICYSNHIVLIELCDDVCQYKRSPSKTMFSSNSLVTAFNSLFLLLLQWWIWCDVCSYRVVFSALAFCGVLFFITGVYWCLLPF